jgi:uncharacterized protein
MTPRPTPSPPPSPLGILTPSLTDVLCTTCGLCCDGTLFADVELGRAEAARLENMGLEVEVTDGGLLSQPCAALKDRRCSIYAHRPKCCRTFECQLLQDAQRGAVTAERALEQIVEAQGRIQRVRDLLTQLGERQVRLPLKERCAAALAGEAGTRPDVDGKRAELDAAARALDRMIESTFLGRGK